mmetsp:Transcript_20201/g.35986  ORF Transcript_20201/g.35986 Transcript_20201/m.35986 type:complete len:181 (-) Transcript_20201:57-599(-)
MAGKPSPYVALVQKKRPTMPYSFDERVLLVEHGRLYWSTDWAVDVLRGSSPSLAKLDSKRWCACIDLGSTPCEVKASDTKNTVFMLEPLPGHVWSTDDTHSRTGTSQRFVFEASNLSAHGVPEAASVPKHASDRVMHREQFDDALSAWLSMAFASKILQQAIQKAGEAQKYLATALMAGL